MKVICVYIALTDTKQLMRDLGPANVYPDDDHRPGQLAGQCACIQISPDINGLQFGCWCTDPESPIGQVLEACSLMVTEHGTIFTGISKILVPAGGQQVVLSGRQGTPASTGGSLGHKALRPCKPCEYILESAHCAFV